MVDADGTPEAADMGEADPSQVGAVRSLRPREVGDNVDESIVVEVDGLRPEGRSRFVQSLSVLPTQARKGRDLHDH